MGLNKFLCALSTFIVWFAEIRYNFAHNDLKHLSASWKWVHGKRYFSNSRIRYYGYGYTVKPYNILKVKNAFQSSHSVTSFSETASRSRLDVTMFNLPWLIAKYLHHLNHCGWISFSVTYKNVMLYISLVVAYFLDHPNLQVRNGLFTWLARAISVVKKSEFL
jgi:hypothetical protein